MAGSVGQVFYDVLPNLDGFAAKVAAGVRNTPPVKIPVQADTKAAEASARKLTTIQTKEAERSSRQRMALIQRDAIAENRYRDRAARQAVVTAQRQAREEAKARAVATRAAVKDSQARKQALQSVGTGLAVGGAATLAGLAGITKVTADFDKAVSNVASTGKEAQASIGALRAEAIKYGADTAFSATEAANAQAELIKANVSVSDTINGGLKGALDLAAAGSLGVADAAGIMGTAMSQFKIPGTQASHVADLLSAAAGKAQGEVQDFAEALKYVGPLANSAGVSIEETTGVLAEFANQGILGSQAGTSLRGIFLSLTAPIGAGAKAIEKYGINVRDANGEFIGLEGAAGELQKRLGGLSRAQRDAALAAIFGKNAITAANILYEGGAEGVRQWTDAVNESGFAARTAATKMDNLAGDVEQLKGALDSAFISSGGGGTAFLRDLTQGVTGAIDGFNGLPPAIQEGTFKLAALVGAGALAAGGLIKIVGAAAAAKTALATLGVTAVGTKAKLALLNGPALLAAAGFIAVQAAGKALENQLEKNSAGVDGYKSSLDRLGTGDLDKDFAKVGDSILLLGQGVNSTESAFKALADTQNPVSQGFRKIGDALGMASTAGILADEFDKIDKALVSMNPDQAAAAFSRLSDQARGAGLTTEQINKTFDDYKAKQAEMGAAAESSFRQSEIAFKNGATGVREVGKAAQLSADDLKVLTDQMYASASASLALSGNAIAVEAAMDAARDAAQANGETLDINTAKGRANQQALDALVAATLTATSAMQEQGKSAGSIAERNERAKASWIDNAVAMGKNRDRARELADELFVLPAEVSTQVVVSGAKVSRKEARDLNAALKGIPKSKRANIVTIANTKGAKAAQTEIAKVKNKSVIAKATGKGVNTVKEIDAAIKKLKSKAVRAQANAAGKGAVNALDNAIKALKNKRVAVSASASGEGGVRSLAGSINGVKSKTVTVRVVTKKSTLGGVTVDADGGTMGRQYLAGGGTIRGVGGPRQDNIATFDRDSGVQVAWTSVGEELINTRQSALHRAQLKRINAGGQWDIIPRRRDGGTIGQTAAVMSTSRASGRSLTLNLDMGPLFGGVQQLVLDLIDDRDEYSATLARMGG